MMNFSKYALCTLICFLGLGFQMCVKLPKGNTLPTTLSTGDASSDASDVSFSNSAGKECKNEGDKHREELQNEREEEERKELQSKEYSSVDTPVWISLISPGSVSAAISRTGQEIVVNHLPDDEWGHSKPGVTYLNSKKGSEFTATGVSLNNREVFWNLPSALDVEETEYSFGFTLSERELNDARKKLLRNAEREYKRQAWLASKERSLNKTEWFKMAEAFTARLPQSPLHCLKSFLSELEPANCQFYQSEVFYFETCRADKSQLEVRVCSLGNGSTEVFNTYNLKNEDSNNHKTERVFYSVRHNLIVFERQPTLYGHDMDGVFLSGSFYRVPLVGQSNHQ